MIIFNKMEKNPIFSQIFEVQSYQIAENFDVTLQNVLGMMQHTAERHVDTKQMGWKELNAKGCFWAIYRMGLRIHRMPRKYEQITLRTWANPPQNLLQPRSFDIVDTEGNTLIEAQSLWIILDNQTFKPQRVEDIVGVGMPYREGEGTAYDISLKIARIAGAPFFPTVTREVLYSDIDTNHHVNNTNYVRWFLDSLPADFIHTHQLREVVINYVEQARLGDRYEVTTVEVGDGRLGTTIVRQGTQEEFCKIVAKFG